MSEKILKHEFKINVGCVDSFIRIFIGMVLLCGALIGTIGFWGIAGSILVITGLSRYCPFYAACRLNSARCDHEIDD